MSIDLGAILDGVQPVLESAIISMGTEGSLLRNPGRHGDQAVDPATLAVTDPTPDQVMASAVPAIVVPATGGAQNPDGPHLTSTTDDYLILLLPDQTAVVKHWLFRVDASRDPRLVGRQFHIVRVADGSPGAVRRLEAQAVRG